MGLFRNHYFFIEHKRGRTFTNCLKRYLKTLTDEKIYMEKNMILIALTNRAWGGGGCRRVK